MRTLSILLLAALCACGGAKPAADEPKPSVGDTITDALKRMAIAGLRPFVCEDSATDVDAGAGQ